MTEIAIAYMVLVGALIIWIAQYRIRRVMWSVRGSMFGRVAHGEPCPICGKPMDSARQEITGTMDHEKLHWDCWPTAFRQRVQKLADR